MPQVDAQEAHRPRADTPTTQPHEKGRPTTNTRAATARAQRKQRPAASSGGAIICTAPTARVQGEGRLATDSGAATIWTAMAVAAVTGVAVLGFWLGGLVIARHHVESAADLGALAAASHASEGPDQACDRARWVAERMGVTLLTCRWQRLDALVEVEAPSSGFAGLPGPSAHARAGPAGQP